MKIITIVTWYSILSCTAWSKSDATPMSATTLGIASEARAQFIVSGSWPPMDKLVSIEKYALRTKEPGALILFNTLAEVPGAPVLKADGVKVKYPGFRLYAISRIPNFERAYTPEGEKTGGRYAVLFKEQNGNHVIMEIPWLVESEAQNILQQIGGFDSKRAPFVFEDTYVKLGGNLEELYENNNPTKYNKSPLSPTEAKLRNSESPEASSQQENSRGGTSLERPYKSGASGEDESSDAIEKRSSHLLWGIISSSIGLLVVALAAWLKLRNSKSIS